MIARDVPAFNVATRGIVYFHVTLRTGERDLHSGMFGGAALNAAHALVATLDALIAHDGTLVEPLRKGIAAPTDEELAGWAAAAAGRERARPTRAHARRTRARPRTSTCRTFAEPALDVNGIATGSPHLQKTVLPGRGDRERLDQARAGPERRGDRAGGRAAAARGGARRAPSSRSSSGRPSPPGLVPPDAKAVQLGLDAFERALGRRPALIRIGGTLPIVPALTDKGIPTVDHRLRPARLAAPLAERTARRGVRPLGIAAARELLSGVRVRWS